MTGGRDPVAALASSVVLVTGVMAAGKSTVAQLIAERLPRAAHVRGDVFRRMMVTGRADPTPAGTPEEAAQLRLRHRLSAATADTYAAAGWTAVVQDIVIGPDLADWVAAVTTPSLYVVVLAPSPTAVARREAERPKTGYGGGWTVASLDTALRRGTPRLGLWLDTSRQTPDETVRAVLARLPEARIARPAAEG
ncbi:AAA family ATPase [Streptomyces sp. RFCAC02]|uniref:AAA family ATPase n=1 Tax=Streptomyces sp. RFCAC02 TaxID=2499143 RepID=UPI0023EA4FBD|nr:AAA family ATPase [Streptomyces sp. RFCAC02]